MKRPSSTTPAIAAAICRAQRRERRLGVEEGDGHLGERIQPVVVAAVAEAVDLCRRDPDHAAAGPRRTARRDRAGAGRRDRRGRGGTSRARSRARPGARRPRARRVPKRSQPTLASSWCRTCRPRGRRRRPSGARATLPPTQMRHSPSCGTWTVERPASWRLGASGDDGVDDRGGGQRCSRPGRPGGLGGTRAGAPGWSGVPRGVWVVGSLPFSRRQASKNAPE